jgi:hypothetical protein
MTRKVPPEWAQTNIASRGLPFSRVPACLLMRPDRIRPLVLTTHNHRESIVQATRLIPSPAPLPARRIQLPLRRLLP